MKLKGLFWCKGQQELMLHLVALVWNLQEILHPQAFPAPVLVFPKVAHSMLFWLINIYTDINGTAHTCIDKQNCTNLFLFLCLVKNVPYLSVLVVIQICFVFKKISKKENEFNLSVIVYKKVFLADNLVHNFQNIIALFKMAQLSYQKRQLFPNYQ